MSPRIRRLLQGTGLAMLLLAAGLLVLPVLPRVPHTPRGDTAAAGAAGAKGLPELGEAPSFSLTDQLGGSFGTADLAGRVWVVDFVFTRCPAICPILSRQIHRLQEATAAAGPGVADATRFVSISVDPEHDTPAVLAAYADRHDADPDRWRLLTGGRDEVWSLIRDGFRLLVAENPGDPTNPILHTPRLLLVDAAGQIRGMYDGTVPAEVDALERDLLALGRVTAERG